MTVHKLSASDGYTYLTRQVASADEQRPAGQSLADYYTARGNPPGVWLGRGAEVLGVAGTEVSEAQMKALFGAGRHPEAEAMLRSGAPDASTRLGAACPTYSALAPLAERMAQRTAAFTAEQRRAPTESEQGAMAVREARRDRRAVAGFDLVFSPVKSASLLWALGGPEVRGLVEDAHHEAVRNTINWIEQHAALTRTGHGGVAQIDTDGLVCAAFDHRESRAGDPDLHTHVAVANKVRGVDAKWRSLDARGLHALGVAASERYNTRLEDALAGRLGVRFLERPGTTPGKRPVREIAGMPTELIRHFSRRRTLIEGRLAELCDEYRTTHGREPGHTAELQLAQQATLETREHKGQTRTLGEQVEDWTEQARVVIGDQKLGRLILDCIHRPESTTSLDSLDVAETAARVVRAVAERRSTWTVWNIYAEAERQTRSVRMATPEAREVAIDAVVAHATSPALSIRIAEPALIIEPADLVRASDGQSVFVPHGSERITTSEVLLAEDRLVDAARTPTGPHLDELVLEAALAIQESRSGLSLDPGQRELVEAFALSPRQLAVGIGPAGTGKTTAMRAVAEAWQANGGRVIALATSARAAEVLGAELGLPAENLHKFLFENDRAAEHVPGSVDQWFRLQSGDLVLLDEAGMAGTLNLDRLVQLASQAGAAVRLLGDPAQLASVEAGGALRLLEREVGATHLCELHRFADPDEAAATLALRRGDPVALDFYQANGRIKWGPKEAMLEGAYNAWSSDVRDGLTSVLVAGSTQDVAALNLRARTDRIGGGDVEATGVVLRDGNTAGVGDWVTTRTNARTLRVGRRGWVRNGDTWRVVRRHRDGSLAVRPLTGKGRTRLPADYVGASVELGYATTVHRVQGATTDTAHALVTDALSREGLYVASTRGRHRTSWYTATDQGLETDCAVEPDEPRTARDVLTAVLARRSHADSARETIRTTVETATSLATLAGRYQHAWSLAAHDLLRQAAQPLPSGLRHELVDGPGATQLAQVLATAATHGADPGPLLAKAVAMGDPDDLDSAHSPALVVATRITDHRHWLGIPQEQFVERPLPWLPSPDVGPSAWTPYLRERAHLIKDRADDLGSLAGAYQGQYGVSDSDGSLGPPPPPGTSRAIASQHARPRDQPTPTPPRSPAPPPALDPSPARTNPRPPHLSR